MVTFGQQVNNLKTCVLLRGVLEDERCWPALEQLEQLISDAETNATDISSYLDDEEAELALLKAEILPRAEAQLERVRHAESHLPAYLPTAVKPLAPVQPVAASAKDTLAKTSKPASAKQGTSIPVPTMAIVKVDEFEATPAYIRGRLSRDHVNECVQAIMTTVSGELPHIWSLLTDGSPHSQVQAACSPALTAWFTGHEEIQCVQRHGDRRHQKHLLFRRGGS